MKQMKELGIEGPRKQQPGGTKDFPFFWTSIQPPEYSETDAARQAAIPTPEVRRRRAESRAAAMDTGPDFQDVYDSRKIDSMQRLQSIREPQGFGDAQPRSPVVDRVDSHSTVHGRGSMHRSRAAFLTRNRTFNAGTTSQGAAGPSSGVKDPEKMV